MFSSSISSIFFKIISKKALFLSLLLVFIVMPQSWSEISPGQKLVYLLEARVRKRDLERPVGCVFCDQIFFSNRVLVSHVLSHHNEDEALRQMPKVGKYVSSENSSSLFSGSPSFTYSLPVQAEGGGDSGSRNHLGSREQPTVSSNPPSLLVPGECMIPTSLPNSVFRGSHNSVFGRHSSSHRPQELPSARTHSNGTFAAQPRQASNAYSPTNPRMPGSNRIAPDPNTRPRKRSARNDLVEPSTCNCTKPYIMKLERPIEERVLGSGDKASYPNSSDQMDLTLKL